MDFITYIPGALGTAKTMPTPQGDLEHASLGLSTESGEFNTAVKRVYAYGKKWDDFIKGSDTITLIKNALEELGDTIWYVPLTMCSIGLTSLPVLDQHTISQMVELTPTPKECGLMLAAFCGVVAGSAVFSGVDDKDARDLIGEMCARIVFLVDRVALMLDSTGDQVRLNNYLKLNGNKATGEVGRFDGGYSDSAAEARADKLGADATVS
jgi:hypothetical protein